MRQIFSTMGQIFSTMGQIRCMGIEDLPYDI